MTDTEKKFKAAFMLLLGDYDSNIRDLIYRESFCDVCPLHDPQNDCIVGILSDDDSDSCREHIFNWYLENCYD